MQEQELYSHIGEDGFTRLIAAFYRQILGPLYNHRDLAGAEVRLRDFLIFRFGGPARYIENRGHPRLRMRHFPFPVTEAARDRWVQLMNAAFTEAQLPVDAEHLLREFFASTATFLINTPTVPQ